ncbi:hypothetical protein [Sphingomonas sp.]|uniref:hypothetical protein n=1 Tax=Sphingomonas sp. TaxID=28214 RepID=UPI001EC4651D|nr:hypothetical protein [Sphingomonas sp.]MBX3594513.1 hypothetical protein [Sphingomonas sp.]
MRIGGAILLLLAGAVAPVATASQTPREAADARYVMRDYAKCAVKREHDLARAFVLMPTDKRLTDKDYARLADGDCLGLRGGQLKMRHELFRGALAEELLATDFKGPPVIDPGKIAPLVWPEPVPPSANDPATGKPLPADAAASLQTAYERALADRYANQIGECVIRIDPAGARAVLGTGVDKPEELEALKTLAPNIGRCVVKGQTLRFTRTTLRNGIAIAYYRMASAEQVAG